MCLNLTNKFSPQVAEEDITVYKVLYKVYEFNEHYHLDWLGDRFKVTVGELLRDSVTYMSPYRYAPYQFGEMYKSVLGEPELDSSDMPHVYNVEEGLHSYANLEDAMEAISGARNEYGVVVKGRIPAGSAYYLGIFNRLFGKDGVGSYASTELILDELVETP